jgi:hypothetical protein
MASHQNHTSLRSQTTIQVTAAETRTDSGSRYTVYKIEVHCGEEEWHVYKRFDDCFEYYEIVGCPCVMNIFSCVYCR